MSMEIIAHKILEAAKAAKAATETQPTEETKDVPQESEINKKVAKLIEEAKTDENHAIVVDIDFDETDTNKTNSDIDPIIAQIKDGKTKLEKQLEEYQQQLVHICEDSLKKSE